MTHMEFIKSLAVFIVLILIFFGAIPHAFAWITGADKPSGWVAFWSIIIALLACTYIPSKNEPESWIGYD